MVILEKTPVYSKFWIITKSIILSSIISVISIRKLKEKKGNNSGLTLFTILLHIT